MDLLRRWRHALGGGGDALPLAPSAPLPPDGLGRVIHCGVPVPSERPTRFESLDEFLRARGPSAFVSAALIAQKAKSVSDGVFAALEQLSSSPRAQPMGVDRWLAEVSARVRGTPAAERLAAAVDIAARGTSTAPLALRMLRDPMRSLPLGFYRWNAELERVFVRDRFLQSPLSEEEAAALAPALATEPALRAAYEAHLRRVARLTDRFSCLSLEGRIESGRGPGVPASPGPIPREAIVPPSVALENDFGSIPEFFEAVRIGRCDLTPDEAAGFYAHQRFALTPLLAPDTTPEARGRTVDAGYRAALERLAGAVFFFGRETHVKQLAVAPGAARAGGARGRVIRPGLTIEPLPSYYRLIASAFRFLERAVTENWGRATFDEAQCGPGGVVARSIGEGITQMIELAEAAERLSTMEIEGVADGVDSASLRSVLAGLHRDPDATRSARGVVPLSGMHSATGKVRVAALVGWESHPLVVTITHYRDLPANAELGAEVHPVAVPVVREFWAEPKELVEWARGTPVPWP